MKYYSEANTKTYYGLTGELSRMFLRNKTFLFGLATATLVDTDGDTWQANAAQDDPLHQFAASGLAYVNFALHHPAYYRVMFSGDLLSSTGNVTLQHTSRDALQEMVSDITVCQQLGVIRPGDPVTQALTILSTIHGFVSLVNDNRVEHLIGNTYSLEDIRDAVLAKIFEGLGTPQPAVL